MECELGINLSADGESIRLNWSIGGKAVTTYWPVSRIPTLIEMLLGAAQEAAPRQTRPTQPAPPLDCVFHPTDMKLLMPSDGSGAILRVSLGSARLDFGISREQASALQKAVSGAPQARQGRGKLDS